MKKLEIAEHLDVLVEELDVVEYLTKNPELKKSHMMMMSTITSHVESINADLSSLRDAITCEF